MPVSSVTNRVQYQGDGTSAIFAFGFQMHAQSDLAVFAFNSSLALAQMITPMVLNGAGGTGFTISGTANASGVYPNGANVVMNSAPNAQTVMVIFRSSVLTNTFSVGQTGTIPATALNNEFDYLTLIGQRLQDQTTRSVRLKDGFAGNFNPTLPPQLTASSVLIINGDSSGFNIGPQADQIFGAQSSAIAAAASAAAAATSATNAATSATQANSAAVSVGNNLLLVNSAVTSINNAAAIVGSTAFWGMSAQSSAVSASNSAALANSAAVSAGNLVALANSAAVSAGNSAIITGSGALSASNSAAAAAASANAASSSVGALSLPLIPASGGTGTQGFQPRAIPIGNGSSALLGVKSTLSSGGILWGDSADVPSFVSPDYYTNHLSNAAFDCWQEFGGSSVVVANSTSVYVPDQWYVTNILGTNGAITASRNTSAVSGSMHACKVQITTAPTAAQANGTELWQVIDNEISRARLFGTTGIAFNAKIKALGNVTQIGVQVFQHSTEVKTNGAHSSVTSEALVTVNSATFTTTGNLATPAWGNESTGVVGCRIRVTAVSTGSTHAVNNGFIVEQANLQTGSPAPLSAQWRRKGLTPEGELIDCMRYFEKSYDYNVIPGTPTNVGQLATVTAGQVTAGGGWWSITSTPFKVHKRITGGSLSNWDLQGNAGKWSALQVNGTQNHNQTVGAGSTAVGTAGWNWPVIVTGSSGQIGAIFSHWTVSARI